MIFFKQNKNKYLVKNRNLRKIDDFLRAILPTHDFWFFRWNIDPKLKYWLYFIDFSQFFAQLIIGAQFHFGHLGYPLFCRYFGEISRFFKPWLWYKGLGHISKQIIQRLVSEGILDSLNFLDLKICIECIKEK